MSIIVSEPRDPNERIHELLVANNELVERYRTAAGLLERLYTGESSEELSTEVSDFFARVAEIHSVDPHYTDLTITVPTAVADEVEAILDKMLDVVYAPDMTTKEVTSVLGELDAEDEDED